MEKENINIIRVRWLLPLTIVFIGLSGYYFCTTWDGRLEKAVISLSVMIFEALFFGIMWGWLYAKTGKVTWL